jgi:arylsulfatase A-like enzyme
MPGRPNTKQIIAHDLGTRLGCYGAGLETPRIDELASDGVLFTDYHCTAAQCSPSRGSISTGLYPHNNGLVGLTWGWKLDDEVTCMPERLRRAGYSTHLFGEQHETAGNISRLGYETRESENKLAMAVANDLAQCGRRERGGTAVRPFGAAGPVDGGDRRPAPEGSWPVSEALTRNMGRRLHEPRFAEWMQMTLRDWPEMLWYLE